MEQINHFTCSILDFSADQTAVGYGLWAMISLILESADQGRHEQRYGQHQY
jgi:hypothetical protein